MSADNNLAKKQVQADIDKKTDPNKAFIFDFDGTITLLEGKYSTTKLEWLLENSKGLKGILANLLGNESAEYQYILGGNCTLEDLSIGEISTKKIDDHFTGEIKKNLLGKLVRGDVVELIKEISSKNLGKVYITTMSKLNSVSAAMDAMGLGKQIERVLQRDNHLWHRKVGNGYDYFTVRAEQVEWVRRISCKDTPDIIYVDDANHQQFKDSQITLERFQKIADKDEFDKLIENKGIAQQFIEENKQHLSKFDIQILQFLGKVKTSNDIVAGLTSEYSMNTMIEAKKFLAIANGVKFFSLHEGKFESVKVAANQTDEKLVSVICQKAGLAQKNSQETLKKNNSTFFNKSKTSNAASCSRDNDKAPAMN